MDMPEERPAELKYPLLHHLLAEKGLHLRGIYTNRHAAEIFGVRIRTIQQWVQRGKLHCRDLPGRGRFLSEDLELFLQQSRNPPHGG